MPKFSLSSIAEESSFSKFNCLLRRSNWSLVNFGGFSVVELDICSTDDNIVGSVDDTTDGSVDDATDGSIDEAFEGGTVVLCSEFQEKKSEMCKKMK